MPVLHENKIVPSVDDLHSIANQVQKRYFNRMQRDVMSVGAHSRYIVASRGTGKSEGVDAPFILQMVWTMPGSMGGLISPSRTKAWGNTLPAICHALSQWGYIQNLHYYVGRKAPESVNFAKPKMEPLRDAWENCIHFWNGTILVVLSFANGMSANSMSLDWIIGPEAKFLDYDKIKSEVNPANRGNKQYFGSCPYHHAVCFTTDMPTSKKGRWILEKENEMSPQHIRYIRTLHSQVGKLKRLPEQTEHIKKQITTLQSDLMLARQYQEPVVPVKGKKREYTVFYAEYDIFDNMEVVGQDYIWQMHRDSPALVWRTAFLNERLFRVPNGFYSALNDDIHFYIPDDTNNHLSRFGSNWKRIATSGCLHDTDLDFEEPLHIAFDSNSAISSCCVGQVTGNRLHTIKSFFVKTPKKLQELVQEICDYYAPKLKKEIVFYYDHTFMWTTGLTAESYADTIIRIFSDNRYNVTDVYIGQGVPHDWKHEQIDLALKGFSGLLFPVFNLYNNEFLKLAMEQTGVRQGKNGFEKDKRPEALDDSPEYPDESKTHITDAWDTLFVGTNYHLPPFLKSQFSGFVGFTGK
ncbi:MAG: hypothetical protein LBJ72_11920 [Dysgonamonadaceae bacterium]|jgi:hypothetical protein|nr:hypothetical protein [Dysgonamonadaceae bacterium]